MTFTKTQITYHASNERAGRLAVIGATVGFGNEILRERYNPKKESWSCFMNSGAMLILNKTHEKLVTGFIPTKEQVIWVYGHPLNKAVLKIIENAARKYERGLR